MATNFDELSFFMSEMEILFSHSTLNIRGSDLTSVLLREPGEPCRLKPIFKNIKYRTRIPYILIVGKRGKKQNLIVLRLTHILARYLGTNQVH